MKNTSEFYEYESLNCIFVAASERSDRAAERICSKALVYAQLATAAAIKEASEEEKCQC